MQNAKIWTKGADVICKKKNNQSINHIQRRGMKIMSYEGKKKRTCYSHQWRLISTRTDFKKKFEQILNLRQYTIIIGQAKNLDRQS